jgi:hypothetical protein
MSKLGIDFGFSDRLPLSDRFLCVPPRNRFWWALFFLVTFFLTPSPALAQYFTILGGSASLTRQGKTYRVGKGMRLYEGDQLNIPRQLQFCVDYCAGVATARGYLSLILIRRESGAIRNLIAFNDYLTFVARGFSNPRSIVQFWDLVTGAAISYPPKQKQASLSFTVGSSSIHLKLKSEQKTYLRVNKGIAEVSNVGQFVTVEAGFANITPKTQPPGLPLRIDDALKIEGAKIERSPLGLILSGKINPLNNIVIQGIPVVNTRDGEFKLLLKYPMLGNQIKLNINSPFGESRTVYWPRSDRK